MPFNSKRSGGGVLSGIKGKLGIGGNRDYDDYDDYDGYDAYSDNFDDYSTYEEEEQNAGDRDMDRYGSVVVRDASDRRTRRSYTDMVSSDFDDRRRTSSAYTPLVSIDDIRANSRSSADGAVSTGRSSGSRTRESYRSSDYMSSGSIEREFLPDAGASAASDAQEAPEAPSDRSSGYDSLFSSTSGASAPASSSSRYGGASATAARRTGRRVTLVAPSAYADVERVSKAMKSGDAVVLNLKGVNQELANRILDFSFGVASVLDAKVDCVGDRLFALTVGSPLSDAERMHLRAQGVAL